ncbi:MAG: TM2 domain-containing protein [Allobaculum sp.]|nr:TM2 domain-containing protein [Allobaculum sp.]
MALINCPECGRQISDQAKSCPGCGTPINSTNATKFCQHCGEKIDKDCVVCPKCGKQVGELGDNRNIIINNSSSSSASAAAAASAGVPIYTYQGTPKNKWVSFFLCLFTVCGHKFYEGKIGMGILYLFTMGLFGIGWILDLISLATKPNPYYV